MNNIIIKICSNYFRTVLSFINVSYLVPFVTRGGGGNINKSIFRKSLAERENQGTLPLVRIGLILHSLEDHAGILVLLSKPKKIPQN